MAEGNVTPAGAARRQPGPRAPKRVGDGNVLLRDSDEVYRMQKAVCESERPSVHHRVYEPPLIHTSACEVALEVYIAGATFPTKLVIMVPILC